jgi:hypothetical protein
VTRLNRFTPAAIPRPIQRKALKLLALAAFAGAFFVIPGPCSSFASSWTKIPWTQPKIPASQISCYYRKTHRFTEERHPDRCEIAGYEGKQRRFVVLPIENLNWGHWGAGRTRAPQATEIGTGRAVRVIAWKAHKVRRGNLVFRNSGLGPEKRPLRRDPSSVLRMHADQGVTISVRSMWWTERWSARLQ